MLVDRQLAPVERDISAREEVGVLIEGWSRQADDALTIGFALFTATGELLCWSLQTDVAHTRWPKIERGPNRVVAWLPSHWLNEGDYRIELIVSLHFRSWFCEPGVNSPVISFKVRGGLSESPYWMMARPGLLAPVLNFETLTTEPVLN